MASASCGLSVLNSCTKASNAAQILGFDPRQDLTASDFLSRVHPHDRDRLKAIVSGVSPERPAYTTTFKQPDGREVWLEETAKAEFDSVGALVRLKGLTLDVTARKRFADQQTLLIATLDHHVKSLLARVAVVAKKMRQRSGSLDEYIQALDHRIQSMADTHALLSKNHWAGADLAELVRRQLAPIATEASATIDGSSVMLTVAASEVLAMVMHELVTNAAKYGALSSPHGRVEVTWTHEDAANLSITWREIGGPAVAASPDCKYGVSVIRDLVPNELNGSVNLTFASGGVCCKIDIPLETARGNRTNKFYSASFDLRPPNTPLRRGVSR